MSAVGAPAGPTHAQLVTIVMGMKEKMDEMKEELEESQENLIREKAKRSLKMDPPDYYNGEKESLKRFLTQADVFLEYNKEALKTPEEQVQYVAGRLKGKAFDWFEPKLRNFLDHASDGRTEETNDIFGNYANFVEKITELFGDVDAVREAERKIQIITQKGSATQYVSEFQQISSRLNWADAPLITQFYRGLKSHVKDDFTHRSRPDKLHEFMQAAVEIDNRHYERQMEKRSNSTSSFVSQASRRPEQRIEQRYRLNTGVTRQTTQSQQSSHWGDPIDLSMARVQGRSKMTPEQVKRYKKGDCIKCRQSGHFAK